MPSFKEKIENLQAETGEMSALTRGKPRWRLTISSGHQEIQEILKTHGMVRRRVAAGGVVRIEKGWALSVLREDMNHAEEMQPRTWVDVTEYYL